MKKDRRDTEFIISPKTIEIFKVEKIIELPCILFKYNLSYQIKTSKISILF